MDAENILKTKKSFAIIGVPQDQARYGFEVFHTLLEHGYTVYPINPKYDQIAGHRCYPSLVELPENPEVVIAVLSPKNTERIIDRVAQMENVIFWMPPGSWSDEVLKKCSVLGIAHLYDICPVGKLKML